MKTRYCPFTKLQGSLGVAVITIMLVMSSTYAATLYVGFTDAGGGASGYLNNVSSYDSTVTGGNPTRTPLIVDTAAGGASGSFKPYGLSLDTAGNLYVSDFAGQIIRYNTNTTALTLNYANMSQPWGSVISGSTLYVAGTSNQAVYNFSTATDPATAGSPAYFGAAGTTLTGIAQDASGNIYVASYGASTVKKYSSLGVLDTNFSLSLTRASGLALDGAGNLYVSSVTGNLINQYDAATGNLLTASMFTTGLNGAYSIALDGEGNLFAANYNNGTIIKYSIAGGNASETLFASLSGSHPISLAFAPIAVPEPSSVALLCIGGLAFVSWRARRTLRRKISSPF